jgi:cytochrome P450/NADPH-cytochrome P450 reductase
VALTAEVCDETRFEKLIGPIMTSLRAGLGNGLITAPTDGKWEHAHRVLVPAFGPFALKDMFGEMKDIASQMVLKFARMGSDYQIPIAAELTKLTLDTLALCAMSCRFNSFYSGDQDHPFIDATTKFLRIAGNRTKRPAFLAPFFRTEDATFEQSIAYMRNLSAHLVKQRRESPGDDKKDLLHAMLNGTDPKTGQGLDEEEIIDNMITFLVAGHETTSGLLVSIIS